MVHIRADNPEIEKEITRLVDLIEDGGGGFHSKMLIVSQGSDLSIETIEPMDRAKELIRLSRSLLLPTDQCDISIKGDEFVVEHRAQSVLRDDQREIFDTMFNLYNLTGKVAFQREVSLMLNLKPHGKLFDKLMSARDIPEGYKKTVDEIGKELDGGNTDNVLPDIFMKTRHLSYNDHVRVSSVSIIMPVIDFINHNWNGSVFMNPDGPRRGDLVVNNSQPMEDSLECYAYYGAMDSLDTLVRYDFVDTSAPILRSVPLEIPVFDWGKINIGAAFGGNFQGKLPAKMQPLKTYFPLVKKEEGENAITTKFLLIPHGVSPRALRHVLSFLLTSFMQECGIAEDLAQEKREEWIEGAEELVLSKNRAFYEELLSVASETQPVNDGAARNIVQSVKALAELQLTKLSGYAVEVEKAA